MALLDELQRPTLLVNAEIARKNIAFMAEKARQKGVRFRPHFKTHQSAAAGEWFREAGVTAIAVSSVDMAVYFADHGWDDITIAFPINVRQLRTVNALAKRIRLGLLGESMESIQHLQEQLEAVVDVWIKIDSGTGRTGLAWDQPTEVARLAHFVNSNPITRLRGLLTHAGNTYSAASREEVCQRYQASVTRMANLQSDLWAGGHGLLELSVGDTPGCTVCSDLGKVDEIRPGNFVFYDGQMLRLGVCSPQQVAAVLAVPVVALHPERSEVVVYGGAVHLSKDVIVENGRPHYGYIVRLEANGEWSEPLPDTCMARLSQEHGILSMPAAAISGLHVGDWLGALPAHICLTVAAMGGYRTLDGSLIKTCTPAEPA